MQLFCSEFHTVVCLCLTQAQEACGPLEIDNALTMVRGLERDMQEAKASAAEGKLRPLPGETVSVSVHSMCMCSTCICLNTTSPTLNIPAASKCPACMQTHSVLFKKHPRTHLRKLVEKMPRVSRAGNQCFHHYVISKLPFVLLHYFCIDFIIILNVQNFYIMKNEYLCLNV